MFIQEFKFICLYNHEPIKDSIMFVFAMDDLNIHIRDYFWSW